ncbi:2,3-bisphosphoglycerate-independent phosphoglycerate mutase [Peredibacter sp. HCB2-198]|uniref:2,3-bisphosphoglycerate-independent phosphoglycerate mutase n=1 Tax=Peredibacter sp. HCB2-198 TaxID=3383025 RepID=UPI0038B500BF
MQTIQNLSPRVLLVVMDGYGMSPNEHKNAIKAAKKPNLDEIFAHYPITTIQPGGEAVGLPKGVAGNSEVGHLNLGAGRPVRQDLVRINEAIQNNTLRDMPKMKELIEKAKAGTKRIHLMGLLSDGGVHAHINHLKEIIKILSAHPELRIYLHAFMDGRDTAKDKGVQYVKDILECPGFVFASMGGRSIGMDRDRRWNKIEHAYKVMIGQGDKTTLKPQDYILDEYKKGIFDEFITPVLFTDDGAIKNGDAVFFYNYRPDRARQITLAMNDPKFTEFPVPVKPGYFLCMSPYVPDELPNLPILFDKEKIKGSLAEYLASIGKHQFKIAETEKYAHVTYFFNGGEEKPFAGEERCLVQSPRDVATYDQKPEMSAAEVTDKLLLALDRKEFSFYLVNYANADMVGHTGNFEAAIKAIEALDTCIGRLYKKCAEQNITMLLTADHGNADQMVYDEGGVHTSHSDSDVPFCVVHPKLRDQNIMVNSESKVLALKDVAPTVLKILNIPKPKDFTGNSIFV